MLTVHGARELRRSLRKAGEGLNDLKQIHKQAAQTVLPVARTLSPKGKTLQLVASARVGATQRAGIIRAGKKIVPYAGPIHWGWPARGIKSQPFIMQAAQQTEPIWTREYHHQVKRLIKQVKGI